MTKFSWKAIVLGSLVLVLLAAVVAVFISDVIPGSQLWLLPTTIAVSIIVSVAVKKYTDEHP